MKYEEIIIQTVLLRLLLFVIYFIFNHKQMLESKYIFLRNESFGAEEKNENHFTKHDICVSPQSVKKIFQYLFQTSMLLFFLSCLPFFKEKNEIKGNIINFYFNRNKKVVFFHLFILRKLNCISCKKTNLMSYLFKFIIFAGISYINM